MFDTSGNTIDVFTAEVGMVEACTTPDGRSERQINEVSLLDERLRAYANHRGRLDAAEAFDLARAHELKIHTLLGCATFFEYMERRLGYAPHAARERLRVARALRTLPEMSAQLAKGELAYSHVRGLTRIVTRETQQAWLDAVVDRNASEVEAMVAGHARGDLPTDPTIPDVRTRKLALELPPEVIALWRQARLVLGEERGIGEISDADLMETLCRGLLNPGSGADGPAQNIGYTQCPDCKRTHVNGAGRALDVRRETAERIACDVRILGSLDAAHPERVTTSVTPRMREQVFARDNFCCQVPGCRSSRNLHVHHIIAQANGGPHALWNLILICGGHHAALHEHMLSMSGRAPDQVKFKWTFQPIDLVLAPSDSKTPNIPRWMVGDDDFDKHVPAGTRRKEREEAKWGAVEPYVPAGTSRKRDDT